ncbi:MAG: DUF177 domain-containing protein [Bacteroidales bacterium]|nr:DUF177 domain-containing protein [Bacteroidales bacterium]
MNCNIDIKGLGSSVRSSHFDLDGAFFEAFESESIADATLSVDVDLRKSGLQIQGQMNARGFVVVPCDRCLEALRLDVDLEVPFVVMFSDSQDQEQDSELIVIGSGETQIDMSQFIYDYVCTSLPLQKVHPEGECDPVMMEKMKEIMK